jgi:hypothetical protein
MEWKVIKGYEGLYEISEHGDVKVLRNDSLRKLRIERGYHRVNLSKNGVKKFFAVHRLVAYAFCVGYKEGLVVNHIDGNKLNNHYSNLEWVTSKENTLHGVYVIKTIDYSIGLKQLNKSSEAAKKPVKMYDLLGNYICSFEGVRDAAIKTGFSNGNISKVCNGKQSQTKSFIFKFAEDSVDEIV